MRSDEPLVERLRAAPDINNARILPPGQRVPEVIVPTALRDEAADRITALREALDTAQNALASANHLVRKYVPDHHWLPRLEADMERIKAARVTTDEGEEG